MENKVIIEELKFLIQLDIDAARTYSRAIDEIEIKFLRDHLDDFRNDHERHVYNLSPIITELGENPPEKSPDLEGFTIAGFTEIRCGTGTESVLNAVEANEKVTNKSYSEACSKAFPPDILHQLLNNYEDEQRHLGFIRQQLVILRDNPHFYDHVRPELGTEPRM